MYNTDLLKFHFKNNSPNNMRLHIRVSRPVPARSAYLCLSNIQPTTLLPDSADKGSICLTKSRRVFHCRMDVTSPAAHGCINSDPTSMHFAMIASSVSPIAAIFLETLYPLLQCYWSTEFLPCNKLFMKKIYIINCI